MFGFGRKKKPSEPAPSAVDEATGIDFTKYRLDDFGADVRAIVDVPGAIGQAAKYAFTLPFVVAIVVWVVFGSRMGGIGLFFFSAGAFVLSFFASTVLGGFFVARKRLDLVSDASGRVVDVIGEMHADVVEIKEGHNETSIQQVAVGLLNNAIFPAVFGTVNTTAETALGPLGRFSSRITGAPLALVQRSVISAIESLPDKEIGQMVADVGSALPETTAKLSELQNQYVGVRDRIDGIVAKVSRTALGSALGFALVATIPLLLWLTLGWLLT